MIGTVPSPRSASAVNVTSAAPSAPTALTVIFIGSVTSGLRVTIVASLVFHVGPCTGAGLPLLSVQTAVTGASCVAVKISCMPTLLSALFLNGPNDEIDVDGIRGALDRRRFVFRELVRGPQGGPGVDHAQLPGLLHQILDPFRELVRRHRAFSRRWTSRIFWARPRASRSITSFSTIKVSPPTSCVSRARCARP